MTVLFLLLALGTTRSLAGPTFLFQANDPEAPIAKAWDIFKNDNGKTYMSEMEERFRYKIFGEKLRKIELHNYLFSLGQKTYTMAMNEFADMDINEVLMLKTGFKMSKRNDVSKVFVPSHPSDIPKSIDWRQYGYVTPVKNQHRCGACWAFSATGALEGQVKRRTGKLVSLSEQNLVDCSRKQGNEACDGGYMSSAFDYVSENGGIDTEAAYPYEGLELKCRYTVEGRGATDTGFTSIPRGNETLLMQAVAEVGPVSVGIRVTESFFGYKAGVFDTDECKPDDPLNHGVLVVGYGSESGNDYWLVKNSWGPSWGDNGYIKMTRNKSNMCGIANLGSYPNV